MQATRPTNVQCGIDSPPQSSIVCHVIVRCALALVSATTLAHAAPLRALAWDEDIAARDLALVSGALSAKLQDLHPTKRTGPLPVKRSAAMFIRALDKPALPDNQPCQIACNVPESLTHPLIVLLPDDDHPTGLRILVVDDNPAGFKWGSHRFINTTPKPLLIRLENRVVNIPSGWKPVDVSLEGGTRGIPVLIALEEDSDKPLYSAVWEHNTDVRTLCFLVPGTDARESPVAFKSIPEDRLVLEFEAKAVREQE